MIIVNADDWGRSAAETDAALRCHQAGRISSVSAMVFMRDSERAAELALSHGLDVGLHLNLSQPFDAPGKTGDGGNCGALVQHQQRVCEFITSNRYAFLLYHPGLQRDVVATCQAQFDEFMRLYGRPPSHVDGHHHKHLCSNVLLGQVIPAGQKVRRNFHFWPAEKGRLNRSYRRCADLLLARHYQLTDYFFALSQCRHSARWARVIELARDHSVELMTHPAQRSEMAFLSSEAYAADLSRLECGDFAAP